MAARALAHLGKDLREHPLLEHLTEVGKLAGQFAGDFEAQELGDLAGRWHDLGKYADDFQAMIRRANGVEATEAHVGDAEAQEGVRGKVDHSSAGAVLASRHGASGLALAFVIAGHHAGLANFQAEAAGKSSPLTKRLKKTDRLEEALKGAQARGEPIEELVSAQVPPLPGWLLRSSGDPRRDKRRCEFFIRMLFSALCDADFLDTERFFQKDQADLRQGATQLDALEDALTTHLDAIGERAARLGGEVQQVRAEVREDALTAGALKPGFFSMTVPTGGGKTLASMAFALRHARHHGLQRVVVAIPYTSIIEQNAKVYRDVFASLQGLSVVEHHSALEPPTAKQEDHRNRLASENWEAPVVVTTTVQLFESMFARRTSRCRKLHNLARSVIVLDEAQTLPTALLPTILDGLQTLVGEYGCSVVICTATQPALARREHFDCGIEGTREIVPPARRAFDRLRRVEVTWPTSSEPTGWPALAQRLSKERDALAIVHLRRDAHDLCAELDQQLEHADTLHLSALMCPEHRSKVLASALERKRAGEPLRLVATQLVEAGVDVDFPVVFRALAGLDALAQAAGRCNREGKLVGCLGQLHVFLAPTKPPKGILQQALGITQTMIAEADLSGATLDLFDPAVQRSFFERLYHNAGAGRDARGIQEAREKLDFEDTAELFQMIENGWAAPVVVPYGQAAKRVAELEMFGPSRARLRALQRFTVSVPRHLLGQWKRSGRVRTVADTVDVIPDFVGVYDQRFGLNIDAVDDAFCDPGSLLVE